MLSRVHIRLILPWITSLTVLGLIHIMIVGLARGQGPIWFPVFVVADLYSATASGHYDRAIRTFMEILKAIYQGPWQNLLALNTYHWRVGGFLSLLVMALGALNSIVCAAFATAFLRRAIGWGTKLTLVQRPAWIVPYFMTYAVILFVAFVAEIGVVLSISTRNRAALDHLAEIRAVPWCIGLFFGVFGTLAGLRFNRRSRHNVQSVFASSNLPDDNPIAVRTRALAERLNLPPPAMGLMAETNAFAVGPSPRKAAVVIGTPLLEMMTRDELDAIIGHELGHILTADMQRLQMAAGFQTVFDKGVEGSTRATHEMGRRARTNEGRYSALFMILGLYLLRWFVTILARVVLRAFSRAREYRADAVGAALTSTEAMISALEKIHGIHTRPTGAEDRYGYMMFRPSRFSLFATHPPVSWRIRALRRGSYRHILPVKVQAMAYQGDPFAEGHHFGSSDVRREPSWAATIPVSAAPGPAIASAQPQPSVPRDRLSSMDERHDAANRQLSSGSERQATSNEDRRLFWPIAAAAAAGMAGIAVGAGLHIYGQAALAIQQASIREQERAIGNRAIAMDLRASQLSAREAQFVTRQNELARQQQSVDLAQRRNVQLLEQNQQTAAQQSLREAALSAREAQLTSRGNELTRQQQSIDLAQRRNVQLLEQNQQTAAQQAAREIALGARETQLTRSQNQLALQQRAVDLGLARNAQLEEQHRHSAAQLAQERRDFDQDKAAWNRSRPQIQAPASQSLAATSPAASIDSPSGRFSAVAFDQHGRAFRNADAGSQSAAIVEARRACEARLPNRPDPICTVYETTERCVAIAFNRAGRAFVGFDQGVGEAIRQATESCKQHPGTLRGSCRLSSDGTICGMR
jgi:heat shock protein HtpX